MECRVNRRTMRTFMVRALSFSAVTALMLQQVLTPVIAADYRGLAAAAPLASDGQMNARFLSLGGTADRARALLRQSRELAPTLEAEIAEAFVTSETDKEDALARLAAIDLPGARLPARGGRAS